MKSEESLQEHLAAIVENSDDAIITKNLDSIILSWNGGAERIFGYSADEAIGRPITILFPDDRQDEEADFIALLRKGERIRHFETIRRRKDGSIIPISLSVSPVRDRSGQIIGASKIARDISLEHRAAEQQRLLLSEMQHRVVNSFAVAGSLLSASARQVSTSYELAHLMRDRLHALSAVHRMAVLDPDGATTEGVNFKDLLITIIAPFKGATETHLDIENIQIAPSAITPIVLIFYEFCTNALKYGALVPRTEKFFSEPNGKTIASWSTGRNSAALTPCRAISKGLAHACVKIPCEVLWVARFHGGLQQMECQPRSISRRPRSREMSMGQHD